MDDETAASLEARLAAAREVMLANMSSLVRNLNLISQDIRPYVLSVRTPSFNT